MGARQPGVPPDRRAPRATRLSPVRADAARVRGNGRRATQRDVDGGLRRLGRRLHDCCRDRRARDGHRTLLRRWRFDQAGTHATRTRRLPRVVELHWWYHRSADLGMGLGFRRRTLSDAARHRHHPGDSRRPLDELGAQPEGSRPRGASCDAGRSARRARRSARASRTGARSDDGTRRRDSAPRIRSPLRRARHPGRSDRRTAHVDARRPRFARRSARQRCRRTRVRPPRGERVEPRRDRARQADRDVDAGGTGTRVAAQRAAAVDHRARRPRYSQPTSRYVIRDSKSARFVPLRGRSKAPTACA